MTGTEDCNLLPIGFTQKKVKYNIIISADGEFVTAQEIGKDEQLCTIPTTPQAESRSGSIGVPFPLADKLNFLVAETASGEENPRFSSYLKQLGQWCESPDSPECLRVLYKYLEKKTLLSDLMSVPNLKLQYHKNIELKDALGSDASSFACFSVRYPDSENRLWMRSDVRESWSRYSPTLSNEKAELCYATGSILPPLQKHPKLSGNAKLISAEDAGFPFRYKGRFVQDRSAAVLSNIASTKAHNALRWLISNQGFERYGMSIVAWNTAVPVLEESIFGDKKTRPDTFEFYARELRNATAGYMERLRKLSSTGSLDAETRHRMNNIVIMGLQAATDGRMSITYYQEIPGNLYVSRLEKWAEDCLWEMPGKEKVLRSPTWREICEAVIGCDKVRTAMTDAQCKKSATKLMREMQMRLLSCIVNASPLPQDFSKQAFNRAVQPLAFTDISGRWNNFAWAQCVSTTCSLIRKKQIQENKTAQSPVLDTDCTTRDYLFGRLFAVAHKIELDSNGDYDKPTVAVRMMARFVQSPATSWLNLYRKLIPYLKRLGQNSSYTGFLADRYLSLLGMIEQKFTPEDRMDNHPLSYEFLTGFSAQLRELYLKPEERQKESKTAPYSPPKDRDSLFGCLLAVADVCEWNAESTKENDRRISSRDGRTNAFLFTGTFVSRPSRTWEQIHSRLIPYFEKSSASSSQYMQGLISATEQRFNSSERVADTPLGSNFLNGYLSMRLALKAADGLDYETWRPLKTENAFPADRDEAFGALLALENKTERLVLDLEKAPEEYRLSNALRFLPKAEKCPATVTAYLLERMLPYQKKLFFPQRIIAEKEKLLKIIEENRWNTDAPLGSGYLHSFYTYSIFDRKENEK